MAAKPPLISSEPTAARSESLEYWQALLDHARYIQHRGEERYGRLEVSAGVLVAAAGTALFGWASRFSGPPEMLDGVILVHLAITFAAALTVLWRRRRPGPLPEPIRKDVEASGPRDAAKMTAMVYLGVDEAAAATRSQHEYVFVRFRFALLAFGSTLLALALSMLFPN